MSLRGWAGSPCYLWTDICHTYSPSFTHSLTRPLTHPPNWWGKDCSSSCLWLAWLGLTWLGLAGVAGQAEDVWTYSSLTTGNPDQGHNPCGQRLRLLCTAHQLWWLSPSPLSLALSITALQKCFSRAKARVICHLFSLWICPPIRLEFLIRDENPQLVGAGEIFRILKGWIALEIVYCI